MKTYLQTTECMPPHAVGRPEHVDDLVESILLRGWDGPSLIGYPFNGTIQLLSGSHRYAASQRLQIAMPVVIVPFEVVQEAHGHLEAWSTLMAMGHEIE